MISLMGFNAFAFMCDGASILVGTICLILALLVAVTGMKLCITIANFRPPRNK
jgi:hypothetical protein